MSENNNTYTNTIENINALLTDIRRDQESGINDKLNMISGLLDRLLNTSYNIQFQKIRQVKLPSRQQNSVKYNLYMPNKLHINDFTVNINFYQNQSLVRTRNVQSCCFLLKNNAGTYQLNNLFIGFYKHDQTGVTTFKNLEQGRDVTDQEKQFVLDLNTYVDNIILKSTEKVYIPTGLKFILPENTYLNIYAPRNSNMASLIVLDNIIDRTYTEQLYLTLINGHNNSIKLKINQPIAQILPRSFILSNQLIQKV